MLFSDSLVGQFTDNNPRFIVYSGTEPIGQSNHQLQAWAMAEAATPGSVVQIFDKLANLGNGAVRTRLRLSPRELAQRIKR